MIIARKIDRRSCVLAVAVALAVPAGALALPSLAAANTLLSGYGAPGAGSQALLGSTLAGGGPRAGGGSGSRDTNLGSSSGRSIEQPALSSGAARSARAAGQTTKTRTRGSSHHAVSGAGSGSSSGGPGAAPPVPLVPRSSVHTDAAGLSGGDLALVFAALAMIVATGFLMARLTRSERREGAGT